MPHFTQSLKKELSFYGFEPVTLITGSVVYEGMDFSFPGALPLGLMLLPLSQHLFIRLQGLMELILGKQQEQ